MYATVRILSAKLHKDVLTLPFASHRLNGLRGHALPLLVPGPTNFAETSRSVNKSRRQQIS